jgi:hypothetical protein
MSFDYEPLRIRSKPREGFRRASAAYVYKSLHKPTTGLLGHAANQDDEIRIKIDDLADRMQVSGEALRIEIEMALIPALRNIIAPGEQFPAAEFDKHKGKFDLQSLLCNIMPYGTLDERAKMYENTLSHVLKRRDNTVYYMSTDPSKHDIIVNQDNQYNPFLYEKSRKIHYKTTLDDDIIERDILRIKCDDVRAGAPHRIIRLDGTSTTGMIGNGKRVTFTMNLIEEQVNEGEFTKEVEFADIIESLKLCTSIEIFRDNRFVIVPFVIENEGLNDGVIIIHVFFDSDSNSKALHIWMEYCSNLLKNMYRSLLRTVGDIHDEAFYARKLGGQLPIDVFRSLKGTLCALSGTDFHSMPITMQYSQLLRELAQGRNAFDYSDTIIAKAFGAYDNLVEFHHSLFTMLAMIVDFNDLVLYRKMTDTDKKRKTSNMIKIIRRTKLQILVDRYNVIANNLISTVKESGGDEQGYRELYEEMIERTSILTSYLYDD